MFEIDSKYYLYIRYFETELLKGFFHSAGVELIKSALSEITFEETYLMSIYNDWDVKAAQSLRSTDKRSKGTSKNSNVFKMITQGNQSALNKSLPLGHTVLKRRFLSNAPGYIVFSRRNASKCRNKDPKNLWFFKVEGLGEVSKWDHLIKDYLINPSQNHKYSTFKYIVQHFGKKTTLTLEEQFFTLSVIPNFHRWEANKSSGVKKEECFIGSGRSP